MSAPDVIGRITLGVRYADLMGRCRAAGLGGSLETAVDVEAECLLDYAVRMKGAKRTAKARRAALESAQDFYAADILGVLETPGVPVVISPDDVLYNRRTATAKAIAALLNEHETRFGR